MTYLINKAELHGVFTHTTPVNHYHGAVVLHCTILKTKRSLPENT